MVVVPEKEDFVNDFYVIDTGAFKVILNAVNESIESGTVKVTINEIYITAEATIDGKTSVVYCPNKIGLDNEIVSIETDNQLLLGSAISMDNLGLWRLVIRE